MVVTTVASLAVSAPALAAASANTVTTFTLAATDGLDITAPTSVDLGSGSVGAQLAGQLGAVEVVDGRSLVVGAWTVTVTSTSFTTGTATTAETIFNSAVSYWSGPSTATTGEGDVTWGQPTAADAVPLNTGQTAFSKSAGAGDNSATFDPTLIINVPAAAVAGEYTGTVTHSLA